MITSTKLTRNLAKLMLVAVLFVGCKEVNQAGKTVNAESVNDFEVSNDGVQILEIDGCQYVWCKNGYGAGLTHKGNCKFCLARSAK